MASSKQEFESLDATLAKYIPADELKEVRRILYGRPTETLSTTSDNNNNNNNNNDNSEGKDNGGDYEVAHYSFPGAKLESRRAPRVTRVGIIQNHCPAPTTDPVDAQYEAIESLVSPMIDEAGRRGVQVLCLQEAWACPFFVCTREKHPWTEFAEPAYSGRAFDFVSRKAREWGMYIVSPVIERDEDHEDVLANTAVVIGPNGPLGKSRKNHIPRVGDFNESTYYVEGNTGHPVFETPHGRIGINICYGRHHPLNWLGYALNGAEIIFNPSATVGDLSEPMWGVEARNAAIANSVFTCAINRVGTEEYPNKFTSGDGKDAKHNFGHFYGSSYIAAPDASRTPSLSRTRDGLLIADCDLNMVRQVRDSWTLAITARYPLYADLLSRYVRDDFKPQRISEGKGAAELGQAAQDARQGSEVNQF